MGNDIARCGLSVLEMLAEIDDTLEQGVERSDKRKLTPFVLDAAMDCQFEETDASIGRVREPLAMGDFDEDSIRTIRKRFTEELKTAFQTN